MYTSYCQKLYPSPFTPQIIIIKLLLKVAKIETWKKLPNFDLEKKYMNIKINIQTVPNKITAQ